MTDEEPIRSSRPARVQLVDGVEPRRELFELALGFVGHDVSSCDGRSADRDFELFAPDLVVIAVDASDDEALRFHHRLLMAGHRTPQIVVAPSALVDVRSHDDRVRRLAAPIALRLLVDAAADVLHVGGERPSTMVAVDDLLLDPASGEAWFRGAALALTPTEFRLLRLLMQHADRVVSKSEILEHVWRYDFGGRTNAVETYVGYLRRKLRPLGAPQIVTIRGSGYSLRRSC